MEVTVNLVEDQIKAERGTESQADTGRDKVIEEVRREIETEYKKEPTGTDRGIKDNTFILHF